MPGLSLLERIASWPWAEGMTVLFGFAWGAMLGSFVNVVAHRLPLGESIVFRRSRCPRCGRTVRAADNVPVAGWIRLRGRCRDCGGVIAATYPLVEAGCGIVGAVLAATHLAGGGRWLPRMAGAAPGSIDRLLRGDWQLLLACGLHAAVVLTIVTWSLLDRQRWPVPASQLGPPLVSAILAVAAVPAVAPPGPLLTGADWPAAPAWFQATTAAASGAAAGWLLGRAGVSAGIRLGLPLLGSVLGWQAVTVVAIVTVGIDRAVGRSEGPGLAGFLLASLATILLATHGFLRSLVADGLAGLS